MCYLISALSIYGHTIVVVGRVYNVSQFETGITAILETSILKLNTSESIRRDPSVIVTMATQEYLIAVPSG